MMKRGESIRSAGAYFIAVALLVLMPCLSYAGNLEPSEAPGTTMKTLDQIPPTWSEKLPCDSMANCPRFEVLADFNNEAVLDKETGLVWQKSLNTDSLSWNEARFYCNHIKVRNWMGTPFDEVKKKPY